MRYMGVDPMEVIRRDTSFAAQVLKVDKDYGTVSEGKYADVIADMAIRYCTSTSCAIL